MAGFRELPLIVNILLAVAVAMLVVGAGWYIPGLPWQEQRVELESLKKQQDVLGPDVQRLRDYQRGQAELKSQIAAQEKQLEVLRTIVPEEKEIDEFIRMVHAAAATSNVEIRRFTAKPVVAREFHNELPFEIEYDGPYFSVWNFFGRLGRLSRIINVSDLNFVGLDHYRNTKGKEKYPVRPGTSVIATCTVTTFYTKAEPELLAAAQVGKRPAKQPPKR